MTSLNYKPDMKGEAEAEQINWPSNSYCCALLMGLESDRWSLTEHKKNTH